MVFQLNSGPNQNDAMTIEVGLPLNTLDGGAGTGVAGCNNIPAPAGNSPPIANNSCYIGNWNGKIESIGNGGFSGSVSSVTSATNTGFVGTSSDDGHSSNWCNATNPQTSQKNAQTNCGSAGAQFMLNPANQVLTAEINDFMDTSLVLQTKWGQTLAQYYYGSNYPIKRTYWNGCSTGGRQGFEMAEYHPGLFDGVLAGYPALNWNRFQIGELWSIVAVAGIDPADCKGGVNGTLPGTAEGCQAGVTTAFSSAFTAANAQGVAACDTLGSQGLGNDIVADGVINEPRYCTFDATTLIGQTISPMTSAMTTAQAQAINSIWSGPFNQAGQRLWGGPTYGTSPSTVLSPLSSSLMAGWFIYWMEQNPNVDFFATLTTSSFATYFQQSTRQYGDDPGQPGFVVTATTDMVSNLASLPNSQHAWGVNGDITNGQTGTKLLHYRGTADQLIIPFNSWNNDTRIFQTNGGAAATQGYYASYYFPGLGHCANNAGFPNAGNFNGNDLFNALINWVENGTAPGSMVAYTGSNDTGNSTLICKYPNQTRWNGTGPTNTASSYSCVPAPNAGADGEDPILSGYDQTAPLYHSAP